MNKLIYDFALWVDGHASSTSLHESFYMYNWVESTHVLALMISLGMLFLIDLRMLGFALPGVPASTIARRLSVPMIFGFTVMFATGLLLFYAIPVRTSQSLWFRIKLVLLVAAALNAFLFHRRMLSAPTGWDHQIKAPRNLRVGAALSLLFWALIVVCGRFIAYDWFDCQRDPSPLVGLLAGCLDGQTVF
ncbi:MAG: DUF6644 family protein [Pseudomonadota bacterium]